MNDHINTLMDEIFSGEQKRDCLKSEAYDFSGELQAQYFSNLRKFLKSSTAFYVMNGCNSIPELVFFKFLLDK